MVRDAAVISACGAYRYALSRDLVAGKGWVLFIMLNPSTADATTNDPTIRRCIGYARDWGFRGIEVGNLFALRATNPAQLRRHPEPVGAENDKWLRRLARRADRVVCAWGSSGELRDRWYEVHQLLIEENANPMALGTTKSGQPRHPLYLRRSARPADWNVL